jgi:hypothetical protein
MLPHAKIKGASCEGHKCSCLKIFPEMEHFVTKEASRENIVPGNSPKEQILDIL